MSRDVIHGAQGVSKKRLMRGSAMNVQTGMLNKDKKSLYVDRQESLTEQTLADGTMTVCAHNWCRVYGERDGTTIAATTQDRVLFRSRHCCCTR